MFEKTILSRWKYIHCIIVIKIVLIIILEKGVVSHLSSIIDNERQGNLLLKQSRNYIT